MKRTLIAALSLAALTVAGAATAQEQRLTREQWQQMSPEEREAARAKAQDRWQSMSPDEQAAAKARMRERYESLPPERQAEVRQRMQERRAAKQSQ